jgi:hypothetical protein
MKYIITESKLDDAITNYLNKLFDIDNINWTHPLDYDLETGEEWDDVNRVVFYIGDYEGEDEGCFYWHECDYFNPESLAREICPIVSVQYEYERKLTGYFNNMWHEPFKNWFMKNFDLPVKTVD